MYISFTIIHLTDMDPVSAAGIGLAVMSLAGQCFTLAMKGTNVESE